jgi:hypothetical protein
MIICSLFGSIGSRQVNSSQPSYFFVFVFVLFRFLLYVMFLGLGGLL